MIKKYLTEIFEKVLENKMPRIVNLSAESAHRAIFAYIGIDRLRNLLDEAEKSSSDKYTSLAELYGATIRKNLSKENSDIIHEYHELLPRLDNYEKAIFNRLLEGKEV